MANEAVLVYQLEPAVPFICADGTGIEKGTLLKLADGAVVSATSADNDVFIGVAAGEKIANDGKTTIAVYVRGVFRMVAGAAGFTVGKTVVISGANLIVDYATLDGEKGYGVGKALQTKASGNAGLVLVGQV